MCVQYLRLEAAGNVPWVLVRLIFVSSSRNGFVRLKRLEHFTGILFGFCRSIGIRDGAEW